MKGRTLDHVVAAARDHRSVALATNLTTGRQLLLDGDQVEGDLALDVIRDGKPRLLDFGVSNDQAWEVGLACGGKIQIFVERVE